jgi:hypothetical protein
VWLARRNLPLALVPAYLGVWTAVEWARVRHDPAAWETYRRGWLEGWRTDPGGRHPIRWHTVYEMARHGRPPVV